MAPTSCAIVEDVRGATFDELSQQPVGRYLSGGTFIHFCLQPTLWGVVLWGRPNRGDVEALVRTLSLELSASAAPHGSVVDASRIEGVDANSYAVLNDYVTSNGTALTTQVTRLAIVRPDGMEGAVVAGFFEVLPKPYPVEVFETLSDALGWLQIHDAVAAAAAIDDAYATEAATTPFVSALRTCLDARLDPIGAAAKRLGVSERTLQRRLQQADTSFQDELNAARIRAAKRLLLDTDEPITTIAFDVGCASPQHFSALFRRIVGVSPSRFRQRR
jgi:AraC-like DNA-binding protein